MDLIGLLEPVPALALVPASCDRPNVHGQCFLWHNACMEYGHDMSAAQALRQAAPD